MPGTYIEEVTKIKTTLEQYFKETFPKDIGTEKFYSGLQKELKAYIGLTAATVDYNTPFSTWEKLVSKCVGLGKDPALETTLSMGLTLRAIFNTTRKNEYLGRVKIFCQGIAQKFKSVDGNEPELCSVQVLRDLYKQPHIRKHADQGSASPTKRARTTANSSVPHSVLQEAKENAPPTSSVSEAMVAGLREQLQTKTQEAASLSEQLATVQHEFEMAMTHVNTLRAQVGASKETGEKQHRDYLDLQTKSGQKDIEIARLMTRIAELEAAQQRLIQSEQRYKDESSRLGLEAATLKATLLERDAGNKRLLDEKDAALQRQMSFQAFMSPTKAMPGSAVKPYAFGTPQTIFRPVVPASPGRPRSTPCHNLGTVPVLGQDRDAIKAAVMTTLELDREGKPGEQRVELISELFKINHDLCEARAVVSKTKQTQEVQNKIKSQSVHQALESLIAHIIVASDKKLREILEGDVARIHLGTINGVYTDKEIIQFQSIKGALDRLAKLFTDYGIIPAPRKNATSTSQLEALRPYVEQGGSPFFAIKGTSRGDFYRKLKGLAQEPMPQASTSSSLISR